MKKMGKWIFDHKFGSFELQSLGGMLGPVFFNLGNRKVSPLFVAPWIDDPGVSQLEPIFHSLRGEFPCVHFGKGQSIANPDQEWKDLNLEDKDELLHGFSAHNHWRLVEQNEIGIAIEIDYPVNSPIKKLTRRITPSSDKPALNIELIVEPRRYCELAIGIHPIFKMPDKVGALKLHPGIFKFGLTSPGKNIEESTQIKPNSVFTSLKHIEKMAGGDIDLSLLLPLEPVECLLQLCGTDGSFNLFYVDEDYHVKLEWDKEHFPSCLLWISYNAIPSFPWNSKTRALGVEPVNSVFDFGTDVSVSENPISGEGIKTFMKFYSEKIWKTNYRLSVY